MCGSWNSVEARAKRAIEEIEARSTSALGAAEEGAKKLVQIYDSGHSQDRAITLTLCAFLFLVLGLFFGWMLFASNRASETETAPAQTVQAKPSAPASPSRRK
jgi:hypothetical protein